MDEENEVVDPAIDIARYAAATTIRPGWRAIPLTSWEVISEHIGDMFF
jgi:hypothetical protein